jgi:hypothetical protein
VPAKEEDGEEEAWQRLQSAMAREGAANVLRAIEEDPFEGARRVLALSRTQIGLVPVDVARNMILAFQRHPNGQDEPTLRRATRILAKRVTT